MSVTVGKNSITMNSGSVIQDPPGTAPSYTCRAWVNINGNASGAAMIRASGNVSSITDYGASDYGVNFATPMIDANFSAVIGGSFQQNSPGTAYTYLFLNGFTTNSARVSVVAPSVDSGLVCVSVFR